MPGLYERMHMESDMTVCVDEISTKLKGDRDVSRKMKDLTHAVHDQTTRGNMLRVRSPRSALIGTVPSRSPKPHTPRTHGTPGPPRHCHTPPHGR
jgi:hypothetical protein